MRVAHLAPVDHVRHLHARAQFIGLRLHREDAHVAGFHVGEHFGGHILQRARRQVFQHEGVILQVEPLQLRRQCRADLQARAIGDQGHFLLGCTRQTTHDRIARARQKVRVEGCLASRVFTVVMPLSAAA